MPMFRVWERTERLIYWQASTIDKFSECPGTFHREYNLFHVSNRWSTYQAKIITEIIHSAEPIFTYDTFVSTKKVRNLHFSSFEQIKLSNFLELTLNKARQYCAHCPEHRQRRYPEIIARNTCKFITRLRVACLSGCNWRRADLVWTGRSEHPCSDVYFHAMAIRSMIYRLYVTVTEANANRQFLNIRSWRSVWQYSRNRQAATKRTKSKS